MSSRPSMPALRRTTAALATSVLVFVLVLVSLSGGPAAASAPPVTPDPAPIATNEFIPADPNFGDCVSSLPRPDCGSDQRGGYHQYLTLGALFLGTVFIAWRVTLGVRARDRVVNDTPTIH